MQSNTTHTTVYSTPDVLNTLYWTSVNTCCQLTSHNGQVLMCNRTCVWVQEVVHTACCPKTEFENGTRRITCDVDNILSRNGSCRIVSWRSQSTLSVLWITSWAGEMYSVLNISQPRLWKVFSEFRKSNDTDVKNKISYILSYILINYIYINIHLYYRSQILKQPGSNQQTVILSVRQ